MSTQPDPAVILECTTFDNNVLAAVLNHYADTAIAVAQAANDLAAATLAGNQALDAALATQREALEALAAVAPALAAKTATMVSPPPGGLEH